MFDIWKLLDLLAVLLFGSSGLYWILTSSIEYIGFCGVMKKSGQPWWYGLVPAWRNYAIGKAADCEAEGRTLMAADIVVMLIYAVRYFVPETSTASVLLAVAALLVSIYAFIQWLRVYASLTDVFGRKHKLLCMFLWVTCPLIMAVVWGFSKNYQPKWTVQDFQNKVDTYFSGANAEVLSDGLTINLEDRSVIEHLKKKYLLRDVHMAIKPGHMVLLLGGSGAGKTTLINAITGYEKANGKMMLGGQDLYREYKKMQYDVGMVPQLDLMRGNDTVRSTLMDAASLRLPTSFTKAERKARVEQVMDEFGLTKLADNMVVKLSGGQRKRLSIAMEYISNPTLFILDEPDSGLDGVMARKLMEKLRAIANQGKMVIVITHTPDRVVDLFDDVIVLAKDGTGSGRLAFFGPIDKARTFFERDSMEQIVRSINSVKDGGEGRADELINRFAKEAAV
ncbi:MAG: ABC transporter ATP-binding protein [Clostridia bacterium]|nr:ABC transporter ATP-binding protein [Clostridia bacterium]